MYRKISEYAPESFKFVLTDETPDRHGEVVKVGGVTYNDFQKNPVMLYQHDRDVIIGKWTNIRVENAQLVADAEFIESDALSQRVKRLVEQGFLNAVSIGFRADQDNIEYKDGKLFYNKIDLLEASIVTIPANPNALRLKHDKGLIDMEDYKLLTKALITKEGRTLSQTNYAKIEQIRDIAHDILDSVSSDGKELEKDFEDLTIKYNDTLQTVQDLQAKIELYEPYYLDAQYQKIKRNLLNK